MRSSLLSGVLKFAEATVWARLSEQWFGLPLGCVTFFRWLFIQRVQPYDRQRAIGVWRPKLKSCSRVSHVRHVNRVAHGDLHELWVFDSLLRCADQLLAWPLGGETRRDDSRFPERPNIFKQDTTRTNLLILEQPNILNNLRPCITPVSSLPLDI